MLCAQAETAALRGAARTIRKHRPFLYYEDTYTATRRLGRRKARVLWDALADPKRDGPPPPHGANVSMGYECREHPKAVDTFCWPLKTE